MKRVIGRLMAILVVGVAILGGWCYFSSHPQQWKRVWTTLQIEEDTPTYGLPASGSLEAEMVAVTSETGGRIVRILAGEGDEVEAGQVLVELSTSLIDAEIRKAEAALGVAQAGAALARASAPPEAIAQAEALMRQAEIAAEATRQTWEDALAIRDAPGALDVQMAATRSQTALAEKQLEIARLQAQAADMELALYERTARSLSEGFQVEVPGPAGPVKVHVSAGPENVSAANVQWNIASQRTWQTYAALNKTEVARDAALQALYSVQAQLEQPIALDSQVHAAEAAYHEAEAAVGIARAALDDLKAGAGAEDIAVAQAAVKQAQAGVDALRVQREKLTLLAPLSGMIAQRTVQVGETLAPGTPVMKIASLDEITLTLYVAVDQIGKVKLGQIVDVTVDSFPNRTYQGTVSHIATEAEFTPKNIQTREERINMVFAIKVRIPNPTHDLKPGMPADAVIRTEEVTP